MSSASSSSSSSSALTANTTVEIAPNVHMPIYGLGTWRNSTPGEIKTVVIKAIQNGYRHLDCAFIYGNQVEIGEGITEALKDGKVKRSDLFITSKVWNHQHKPADVLASTLNSIKDLQCEYLDLQLIHWPANWTGTVPFPDKKETDTSITFQDTWRAMESLVEKKLVRAIGISNFQISEIKELLTYAKIKPAVNQVEMHPFFNQSTLRAYCKEQSIHITAYSPLGNLFQVNEPGATRQKELAAKYKVEPKSFIPLNDETIIELAKKKGKSVAQVILRWSIQHGTTVIPKTVKEERLRENADLFGFELSAEEMKLIDSVGEAKNIRYINPPFRNNGTQSIFPNDHQSH